MTTPRCDDTASEVMIIGGSSSLTTTFAIQSIAHLVTCGALLDSLRRRRLGGGLRSSRNWGGHNWSGSSSRSRSSSLDGGIVHSLGNARPNVIERVLAHVVNVAGLPELPSHLVLVSLLFGRLSTAQADVRQRSRDSGLKGSQIRTLINIVGSYNSWANIQAPWLIGNNLALGQCCLLVFLLPIEIPGEN